ncbi:hypothetical protein [Mesorhizobium sp. M0590]|uniref:hypothetical protein n=1 Tax=unclassified Mesorhizobium TaxID=325217 RepID=UPI00333B9C1F
MLLFWSVLTAIVAALSLGPSFAHVLESVPRLTRWPPSLWRETTVFNAQFQFFAIVGAPLDVAAIACPGLLAWMLRSDRPAFWWILAATVLLSDGPRGVVYPGQTGKRCPGHLGAWTDPGQFRKYPEQLGNRPYGRHRLQGRWFHSARSRPAVDQARLIRLHTSAALLLRRSMCCGRSGEPPSGDAPS